MVEFLGINAWTDKRKEIIDFMENEYFSSKYFRNRLKFLIFCEKSFLKFHKGFMKQYFLEKILELALDKVSVIRKKIVEIIPNFRFVLELDDF